MGSDPFRADVVVRDIEVAPKHASICREFASGAYVGRNLNVRERTVVNGEALRR